MVFGVPGVAFRVPGVRGERERGRRTRSETGPSTTFVDFPPVDFCAVFFFMVRTIAGESGRGTSRYWGRSGNDEKANKDLEGNIKGELDIQRFKTFLTHLSSPRGNGLSNQGEKLEGRGVRGGEEGGKAKERCAGLADPSW